MIFSLIEENKTIEQIASISPARRRMTEYALKRGTRSIRVPLPQISEAQNVITSQPLAD